MAWVYILLSEQDSKRYIGSTTDLDRRLKEHSLGRVNSTRKRRPLRLIFNEEFSDLKEARRREKFFKTHKGYNELLKILRTVV